MARAMSISTRSSADSDHEGSHEDLPVSSPRVCQCENQLAHWDWNGQPRPNLPECCRPAIRNGAAHLQMASEIAVGDSEISVQLFKHILMANTLTRFYDCNRRRGKSDCPVRLRGGR
jgi:hypothetical protein